MVLSDSFANLRPNFSIASVPRIPLPPEVVRIATLGPFIFNSVVNTLPASSNCSTSSTRMAPEFLMAASITRSSVANAPV